MDDKIRESKILKSRFIVLGVGESGENSRYVAMLSEGAGLLWCLAQGARSVESKQRPHLKPYSLIEAAVVRGARMRVRSALETISYSSLMLGRPGGLGALEATQRVCRLVCRVTPYEERDPILFAILENFLSVVAHADSPTLPAIELLAVLRILHSLGYIGEDAYTQSLLGQGDYTDQSLHLAVVGRLRILKVVNDSLNATML